MLTPMLAVAYEECKELADLYEAHEDALEEAWNTYTFGDEEFPTVEDEEKMAWIAGDVWRQL